MCLTARNGPTAASGSALTDAQCETLLSGPSECRNIWEVTITGANINGHDSTSIAPMSPCASGTADYIMQGAGTANTGFGQSAPEITGGTATCCGSSDPIFYYTMTLTGTQSSVFQNIVTQKITGFSDAALAAADITCTGSCSCERTFIAHCSACADVTFCDSYDGSAKVTNGPCWCGTDFTTCGGGADDEYCVMNARDGKGSCGLHKCYADATPYMGDYNGGISWGHMSWKAVDGDFYYDVGVGGTPTPSTGSVKDIVCPGTRYVFLKTRL